MPDPDELNLDRPDEQESILNAAGVLAATRPEQGNTEFQRILVEAVWRAMTGHHIDATRLPDIDAQGYAQHLARRSQGFRMRAVHMMVLSALVLRPTPPEVAARVAEYSRALGVDDDLLQIIAQFAAGDRAMAAVDFERNGYTADWSPDRSAALHTATELAQGWAASEADPALAERWRSLAGLGTGTLGRAVSDFYQARGFSLPGTVGSAPPLLAQHDWVHVLAGYGTKVEAELEVFAFIARANDNPRGFSLLAMVVSLFETGYLTRGAGLFEAFPGQLSQSGMTDRLGDALRRGALSQGLEGAPDVDFMQVDWFGLAECPLAEARELFHIVDKEPAALRAGSVTAFEPGGISGNQLRTGRSLARSEERPYDPHGAA